MKRSMLIALILVCGASMAFAQAGSIGVYTDPGGTGCNFTDLGGLVQVHIVHTNTVCATASQFMLAAAPGWMHLGDTWNFPTVIGTSITGVSVAYGGGFPGPIALGTINFFGSNPPACTLFGIVADPTAPSGLIEGVDCNTPAIKFFPTGGTGVVNNDGSCECNVPVEDTTWGGVKALYN